MSSGIAQPLFLLGSYLVRPALMAHGNIAVVAAEEHLIALRYDVPVLADAGVHSRLAAAGTDGLYLGYRVR